MAHTKSMVVMTRILEGSNEARDNLLAARHRINNVEATSVEISNIKQTIEMGVITVEEGKQGRKSIRNEVNAFICGNLGVIGL